MSEKRELQEPKLAIKPMEGPKGKLRYIPITELEPGHEKDLEFAEAAIAYFDVMGLKAKNDKEEIAATLFDFAAPFRQTAKTYADIRFKIFSDCAFVAAPVEKVSELMSAIRYAFKQWTFDGIFVRGGIALGSYTEYNDLVPQTGNFHWSFFAGTAVVEAVNCERSGTGSLLFATNDFARLLATSFGEPIFKFKKQKVLGWSDDNYVLYRYLGCSLLRLLSLLASDEYDSDVSKRVISNLLTNIHYTTCMNPSLMWSVIYAILSLPNLPTDARDKAMQLLKINDPSVFNYTKAFIEKFLEDKKEINYLLAHADLDSSIKGSLMKS